MALALTHHRPELSDAERTIEPPYPLSPYGPGKKEEPNRPRIKRPKRRRVGKFVRFSQLQSRDRLRRLLPTRILSEQFTERISYVQETVSQRHRIETATGTYTLHVLRTRMRRRLFRAMSRRQASAIDDIIALSDMPDLQAPSGDADAGEKTAPSVRIIGVTANEPGNQGYSAPVFADHKPQVLSAYSPAAISA